MPRLTRKFWSLCAGGVCALALGLLTVGVSAPRAEASVSLLCPATFFLPNNNCNEVLTINANGTVTTTIVNTHPYDGQDDNLVGVIDDYSGAPVTSLMLSGPSGLFGFDGDGICTYAGQFGSFPSSMYSYCSTSQRWGLDPQDYQGPDNTFANYTATSTTGTVDFTTPLTEGGTTFFSLELAPNASTPVSGSIDSPAPEPGTLALLVTSGLGLIPLVRRRMTRKS